MSGQTRSRVSLSSEHPPAKKRAVSRKTIKKWVMENNRTLNTSVWLKFDMADRDNVLALRCDVCLQFKEKLQSIRNFRPAFIEGTTNVRTTPFKEHAATDMHARAMGLYKNSMPVVSVNMRRSRRLYCNRHWTTPHDSGLSAISM